MTATVTVQRQDAREGRWRCDGDSVCQMRTSSAHRDSGGRDTRDLDIVVARYIYLHLAAEGCRTSVSVGRCLSDMTHHTKGSRGDGGRHVNLARENLASRIAGYP